MVSSACEVLLNEPERFIDYVLSDPNVRAKIVDKESFNNLMQQGLRSDPTLRNIPDEIKNKGESFSACAINIYNSSEIKSLVNRNKKNLRNNIRAKVKRERPKLRGTALEREVDRRTRISLKIKGKRKLKQVTIDESLKPIRVRYFDERFNKTIQYRKTKSRSLTRQEKALILNGKSKGKSPSQIIKEYYQAGFKFRTPESIRKHYYRI